MKTLQILIADDHELVRKGLRAVLESQPGWKVCGEAINGRQAVELAKQLGPDVIVLDVTMPELNGLEATRQILKAIPQAEVLILTMHESEQLARELLAAGARGFVFKSDAGRTLVTAIQHLLRHEPYCTSKLPALVQESFQHPPPPEAPVVFGSVLTPREREIIQLIAEGRGSKQVADALGISRRALIYKLQRLRELGHIVDGPSKAIDNS